MESTHHKAGQEQSSKRAGTTPSRSSVSTCSSPSHPPPYSPSSSQSSRKEIVQDVWKEINLTSLHDYTITTNGTGTSTDISRTRSYLGYMALDHPGKEINALLDRTSSLFDKMVSSKGTLLSLSSASGSQFTGMTNMEGPLTSSCKRRVSENVDEFHEKKFKRLMKNRESAARSRARKQAYTNELELEVARLQQENARLRRFKEMLLENHARMHKKPTLLRSSTCPF